MKRVLSMAMAVLMAMSMFTACGKSQSSANASGADATNGAPIEITYCYWGGAADAKARGEIADLFNASQDEIFVKKIPIDNADYVTKIQAYFAAGNEPDVIQS